jgi:hypothetical protein
MSIKEILIIVLVLAVAAISFVYFDFWSCSLQLFCQSTTGQMFSYRGMTSLTADLSHFNGLI